VDAVRLEVERERAGLRAGSGVVAATARETEEHRDQGRNRRTAANSTAKDE
jgi:hypothetical protein